MWPEGTCKTLGLEGKTNITLDQMVSAMVNVSNSPSAAAFLNQQLKGMFSGGAFGGAGTTVSTTTNGSTAGDGSAVSMVTNLAMNCTEMPAVFMQTAAEISNALFCGYYQARCGQAGSNKTGQQQFTAAFDWKATDDSR